MLTCLDWRIIWLGIVTTLVFTVGGLGEIIDSPSLWVNYDLSKLDDALISELNRNLLDRGAFLLPGFLSEDFLATLQQEVHGAQTARYEKMRTILQDSGDFSGAFPDDSIRNILFNNSMNFIPRTFFPDDSMIHHFYEGDFFLEFLKLVVGSSEVYRSGDDFSVAILFSISCSHQSLYVISAFGCFGKGVRNSRTCIAATNATKKNIFIINGRLIRRLFVSQQNYFM
mmetsp:Transcript_29344/g.47693  ORF Transcript_29344/g.47693 Transcript_29344/m.47693 type:complete len:227 (-) Transcript_29344:286-966(-)